MGTAWTPSITRKPLKWHVTLFPTPNKKASTSEAGTNHGPRMRPIDCKISERLKPNMIRRYGVESPRPFFGKTIIEATATEATKDRKAAET